MYEYIMYIQIIYTNNIAYTQYIYTIHMHTLYIHKGRNVVDAPLPATVPKRVVPLQEVRQPGLIERSLEE